MTCHFCAAWAWGKTSHHFFVEKMHAKVPLQCSFCINRVANLAGQLMTSVVQLVRVCHFLGSAVQISSMIFCKFHRSKIPVWESTLAPSANPANVANLLREPTPAKRTTVVAGTKTQKEQQLFSWWHFHNVSGKTRCSYCHWLSGSEVNAMQFWLHCPFLLLVRGSQMTSWVSVVS